MRERAAEVARDHQHHEAERQRPAIGLVKLEPVEQGSRQADRSHGNRGPFMPAEQVGVIPAALFEEQSSK